MIGPILVFLFHNLLLLYLWSQSNKRNGWIGKKQFRFLLIIYIFLAIFGLQSGDYLHHIEEIEDVYAEMKSSSSFQDSMMFFHMEPIYNYLAYWVKGNYIIWRAIVFGISFVILFYTVRKLQIEYWKYFVLFTLISFSGFIVGRMYWGVCLFFCSIACAQKTGNKWYLLPALIAMVGHKALYVLPAFIPLSYMKINKKNILIAVGVFVLMTMVLGSMFDYLNIFVGDYSAFNERNLNYYEDNAGDGGAIFGQSIGEKLIYFTEFLAMLIATIYMMLKSLNNKIQLPNYIQSMLSLGFMFLLFAFAFYFVGMGGIYTWRYITISWFPLTFVLFYFIKNRLISSSVRSVVMGLLLFSFEASLTVPIYYAAVGGGR